MKKINLLLILTVVVLALLPLVNAVDYVGTTGLTLSSTDTDARKNGYNFTFAAPLGVNGTQVKGTLLTGDTSTMCYVYDQNGTMIGNGTVISLSCTVNTTSEIRTGRSYYMVADAQGASADHKFGGVASYPYTNNVTLRSRINEASAGVWSAITAHGYAFQNITVVTSIPVTPAPSISFNGATPTNATTVFHTTNITISANASDSASYAMVLNIYNSSGSVVNSYCTGNSSIGCASALPPSHRNGNPANGITATFNFNNVQYTTENRTLPPGTYTYNVNFTNGTYTNISETRIIYVYELTTGSITSPSNNSVLSSRYVNFTWTNGTITPTAAGARVTNFSLSLYASDGATFNQSIGATSQLNFTNFDIFNLNLATGIYWIRLTTQDNNSRTVTTMNLVNITRNSQLNVTVKYAVSGANLTSGSLNITDLTSGWSSIYSTTNGYFEVPIIKGNAYSLILDFTGYALTNINYTTSSSSISQNLTALLYSNNSIIMNIYDESTGILITNQTISITISGVTSTSGSTTNGTFYIANLADGLYQISFLGTNYALKSYQVTVGSRSSQTLNAFLTNSTLTTIFTIRDFDSNVEIQNATVTQSRLINGSWTITDSKFSDITGRVELSYVDSVKYQFIISKTGYNTNLFYLDPVLFSSYDIRLTRTTTLTPINTPAGTGVSITYTPVLFYNNQTTNFSWIISSPIGALSNYRFNITFPGGNGSYSGTNAIGQQFQHLVNITNANLTSQVIVSYCYTTSTSSQKCFSYPYSIGFNYTNYTFLSNQNNTYGMGVFDRILVVTVIIIVIGGIAYALGGILAGTALVGFLWGYFYYTGFVPLWAILPSMLMIFFLLIGRALSR